MVYPAIWILKLFEVLYDFAEVVTDAISIHLSIINVVNAKQNKGPHSPRAKRGAARA